MAGVVLEEDLMILGATMETANEIKGKYLEADQIESNRIESNLIENVFC